MCAQVLGGPSKKNAANRALQTLVYSIAPHGTLKAVIVPYKPSHPHQVPALPPLLLPQRPDTAVRSCDRIVRLISATGTTRSIHAIPLIDARPAVVGTAVVLVLLADPPQRVVEASRKVVDLPRQRDLVAGLGLVRLSARARWGDAPVYARGPSSRTPGPNAVTRRILRRWIAVPGPCRRVRMSGVQRTSGTESSATSCCCGPRRHPRFPTFLVLMRRCISAAVERRSRHGAYVRSWAAGRVGSWPLVAWATLLALPQIDAERDGCYEDRQAADGPAHDGAGVIA